MPLLDLPWQLDDQHLTIKQGKWRWRYWGNAQLHPLKVNWDLSGDGYWINSLLVVNKLNTGFDKIQYGMINIIHPRLTLSKPLKWQRDAKQANFAGELILHANKIQFGNESFLPATEITAKLIGRNPADFQLTGALSAQQIGPIPFFIRWMAYAYAEMRVGKIRVY